MLKNYTATGLINICNHLEDKYIGTWDFTYHNYTDSLKIRLSNLIGLDFALNGEEFRERLYNDIKAMMFIDDNGKLQYK